MISIKDLLKEGNGNVSVLLQHAVWLFNNF